VKRVASKGPAPKARRAAAQPARARPGAEDGLVKMSVLARMSGVPAATIKHYVHEGLLPDPVRTSRNMAYYPTSLVERVQRIKHLQRTRFLPLDVIRRVLDESSMDQADEAIGATLARVLEPVAPVESRTRADLVRAGMPPAQLDFLIAAKIVAPDPRTGSFSGDDLELLRVLGAARRAGLDPEMLPVTVLGEYAAALRALVAVELRAFRDGVAPRAGANLSELTEAAAALSERLVVLLRRKMLLPTLRAMAAPQRGPARRAPRAPPAR
jgi:DNA-binding transcriptional MerR regulator